MEHITMWGFGKKYTEVISPKETLPPTEAEKDKQAVGDIQEKKRKDDAILAEQEREKHLTAQAAKSRGQSKQNDKVPGDSGDGGWSNWVFVRGIHELASWFNMGDEERQGEVMPEQPTLPLSKEREKIDPAKVVNGKSWDPNETVLDRIKRQTPDDPLSHLPKANRTKAGTQKREVGK